MRDRLLFIVISCVCHFRHKFLVRLVLRQIWVWQVSTGKWLLFIVIFMCLFYCWLRLIDWVKILHLTPHTVGHFGVVLPNQSLGLVAPYGLWDGNVPWFMCWFQRYINCLFVCLLNFLLHFIPSLLSLYLFAFLLVYILTYLSTPSRIGLFRFQAEGRIRWPQLASVFVCFILCGSIFCYGCMLFFVVFVFLSVLSNVNGWELSPK